MANLIEIQNVSVVRGRRTILHDLSLSVPLGEHVAILGPNGCGKSTLIKLLTRELYGHAGRGKYRVLVKERWTQAEIRTVLGIVSGEPREPLLGQPTGIDLAISGLFGTYGVLAQRTITSDMVARGRLALAHVNALHLAEQPLETMSTGEERRCWIARALVSQPKGLVLDEPTAGLDFVARGQFLQTIRELARTTTVVLVTHHLEEVVPEIGRVVLMREGGIVADGPRGEVLTRECVASAFGCSPDAVPLHLV